MAYKVSGLRLLSQQSSPAVGSNTSVHAAVTLGTGTTAVTTAITNPAVCRNLVVKGNATGIAENVVIVGTDYLGGAVTETIALNGATAVAGLKAFRTVTSITLPAKTNGSGDTVSIGTGAKLGLRRRLDRNTVTAAYFDGAKEGTAPTVTISATVTSLNTATLSTALDGSTVVIDFYG